MLFFFVYIESDPRLLALSLEGLLSFPTAIAVCAFARLLREELCAFVRPLHEESAPGIRQAMPALSPSKGSPLRLSPVESALPQNVPVTPLESAPGIRQAMPALSPSKGSPLRLSPLESAPGIRQAMPALSPSKGSPLRLSPLESALPQNVPVTPLQSALPNLKDLKSHRITLLQKKGGVNC
jgi:hypothetical protein